MVLQLLSELGYRLVEQSWIMSTVFVKYFLFILGVKILAEKNLELNHISEQLIDYSGEVVTFVVLLGLINVFAGFPVKPIFPVFSQVVAFLYFGFLFWKY